jgi:hypothetical protein
MSHSRIQSFQEFWPYYLGEHRKAVCRAWHYFGTTASLLTLLTVAVTQQWHWIWLIFIAGYGPAWVGHFVFEKNKPATFQYPLWSLIADYKMFFLAIRGGLSDELKRYNLTQDKRQE